MGCPVCKNSIANKKSMESMKWDGKKTNGGDQSFEFPQSQLGYFCDALKLIPVEMVILLELVVPICSTFVLNKFGCDYL